MSPGLDLSRPWALQDGVALRPEPFGALAYSFTTRRLSFLKSPVLLKIVQSLSDHPSARAACDAAGVTEAELPTYARALQTLADTDMITARA